MDLNAFKYGQINNVLNANEGPGSDNMGRGTYNKGVK